MHLHALVCLTCNEICSNHTLCSPSSCGCPIQITRCKFIAKSLNWENHNITQSAVRRELRSWFAVGPARDLVYGIWPKATCQWMEMGKWLYRQHCQVHSAYDTTSCFCAFALIAAVGAAGHVPGLCKLRKRRLSLRADEQMVRLASFVTYTTHAGYGCYRRCSWAEESAQKAFITTRR